MPSQGLSTEQYQRLTERFARRHGLAAEWIVVSNIDDLLGSVEEGRADIAVSNLTVTESRKQRVAFSLPLTRSREWVVGTDEKGRFGVAADTAYVDSLERHYPESLRLPVPADTDPIGFQALIEAGTIDATIMDEATRARDRGDEPAREKTARTPGGAGSCVGAAARESGIAKDALDAYLLERHTIEECAAEFRDWDAIIDSTTES